MSEDKSGEYQSEEMMSDTEKKYQQWLRYATDDPDVVRELIQMKDDPAAREDAFYQDLTFGTGGLRGVRGAGTNRINIYTVARASRGLASYLMKNFPPVLWKIAVSYDSRIKSDLFARTACEVFAQAGLKVCLYPRLMPTPCLSYAVRTLKCGAGVMITASHNPSEYNGYKVYGPDGCQITTKAAGMILEEIEAASLFCADTDREPRLTFEQGISSGQISYIGEEVLTAFLEEVRRQSPEQTSHADNGPLPDRSVPIVYTPLNGAGREPVLRVLRENGYSNVTVVAEQEMPDGNFPTCPYPNPEIPEAMSLGLEYAARAQAELLIANDPDCDRVGVAVRTPLGDYKLLSGNEVGILLLDYLCTRKLETGTMPADPVMFKTIVTSDLAEQVAAHYGVRSVSVLTGFKYIGEQIGLLEAEGREDSYVFGMEESCGYLSGTYVRDKDGVDASFLICEMCSYYRARSLSLYEKLQQIYSEYGYCLSTMTSRKFEGAAGMSAMREQMGRLRACAKSCQNGAQPLILGGKAVTEVLDYAEGRDGLPASDVLKLILEGHCSVVVRPSGTEPKLKTYISVTAQDPESASVTEARIAEDVSKIMQ